MKSLKRSYLLYAILSLAFFLYCVAFALYFVIKSGSFIFFIAFCIPIVLTFCLSAFWVIRYFKLLYYEKTSVVTEGRFISVERISNFFRIHRLTITVEIEYGGKTLRVQSLYPYGCYGLSYLSVDVPITVGYIEKKESFRNRRLKLFKKF